MVRSRLSFDDKVVTVARTSKASIVLLSVKMLNVTNIHGVRAWVMGTVLLLAGVVYGVAVACNCGQGTGIEGTNVYQCFPPKLLLVSFVASKYRTDLSSKY